MKTCEFERPWYRTYSGSRFARSTPHLPLQVIVSAQHHNIIIISVTVTSQYQETKRPGVAHPSTLRLRLRAQVHMMSSWGETAGPQPGTGAAAASHSQSLPTAAAPPAAANSNTDAPLASPVADTIPVQKEREKVNVAARTHGAGQWRVGIAVRRRWSCCSCWQRLRVPGGCGTCPWLWTRRFPL